MHFWKIKGYLNLDSNLWPQDIHENKKNIKKKKEKEWGLVRIRTHTPLIRALTLYLLSYEASDTYEANNLNYE